jgi:hypothetical protein
MRGCIGPGHVSATMCAEYFETLSRINYESDGDLTISEQSVGHVEWMQFETSRLRV